MPGYIVLGKYTPEGLAKIKEVPARVAHGKAVLEKMGIRLVGIWWTLGQYDMVAIYDAPDDATMAKFMLWADTRGISTGQTMRAFGEEEFATILGQLP
jgi:uncharacterized protein with GYD domain